MTSASPHAESRPRRSTVARTLRWLIAALLVVLLLPYLLTVVYRFVDPVSTLMVWRWMKGAPVERTWVPMDQIAPVLPLTVIGSEDARFCAHSGIDWQGLQDAMDEADDLSEVRGGSTITQQVAKNLFLWPGRSFVRKALEAPLALWIDLVLPKRRVMEIYLNIAEWGPNGVFGVEEGAKRAFGKPARSLNAGEAAIMAAVLPNPIRRSAKQPGPAVRRKAATLQARAGRSPSIDACVRAKRTL